MEKGPDAFRTISEVADDLDLPQHVLRFWETRFAQIKPLKRGGGRRYYRPDDIDLLRGIRQLLYGDGYTIRGVQQILREQGVRHVQAIGRNAENEPARPSGYAGSSPEQAARRPSEGGLGLIDLLPSLRSSRPTPELPRVVEVPLPPRAAMPATAGDDDMPPFPFRRPQAGGATDTMARPIMRSVQEQELPAPPLRAGAPAVLRPLDARFAGDNSKLSHEAVRLLKATLFELGECRRILDGGRDEG